MKWAHPGIQILKFAKLGISVFIIFKAQNENLDPRVGHFTSLLLALSSCRRRQRRPGIARAAPGVAGSRGDSFALARDVQARPRQLPGGPVDPISFQSLPAPGCNKKSTGSDSFLSIKKKQNYIVSHFLMYILLGWNCLSCTDIAILGPCFCRSPDASALHSPHF